ncbi:MAG: 30S ribosomal protein S20 [Patescibacteria group bacterium]|nr:30S ribosomal protein S20 [Patescibacteria group bacterium]
MAKTKSAKKEIRKNLKRRLINLKKKKEIKNKLKLFLRSLKEKDKNKALELLRLIYKLLDKAAKSFLHKNKASRLKSRLTKKFNKTFNE